MSATHSRNQSIRAKLTALALLLAGSVLVIALANRYALTIVESGAPALIIMTGDSYRYCLMSQLANRMVDSDSSEKRRNLYEDLARNIDAIDRGTHRIAQGNGEIDAKFLADPRLLANVQERQTAWEKEIRPLLTGKLKERTSRTQAQGDLDELDRLVAQQIERINRGVDLTVDVNREASSRVRLFQAVSALILLTVIAVAYWIGRGVIRRIQGLAIASERIAAGELTLKAGLDGNDEVAALGGAFDTMTDTLRTTIEAEKKRRERIERLLGKIREAIARLSSSTAEILASTAQQSSGAQEQACAVAQTVTTVDQVAQTSAQAAQRAKGLGEAVQLTLQGGQAGQKAVEESIDALNHLKDQVESTASDILRLAEQAQAIGEIIATVNDIAEQTNILALNAAIEASRAGEHGKGFGVVATEVKALAEQSKKATVQVRQILGEIQRGTQTAVLSTEEVTKGVAGAIKAADLSSRTIGSLTETLTDASQASAQIVASAGQQATGMTQISQAMKNLDQVARQNLVATQQVEQSAQSLNVLGTQLSELVSE